MRRIRLSGIAAVALTLSISAVTRGTIDHISSTLVSGTVETISFNGHFIYGAGGNFLKVFDMTNPDSLNLVSFQRLGNPHIFFHNGYAYVAFDYGYPELYSVNEDGSLTFSQSLDWDCPQDILFRGDTAFVASCWSGFYMYDISSPLNPLPIGNYYTFNSGFYDIEVIGNYALLTRGDSLEVFDISNPGNITQVSSVAAGGVIHRLEVGGNRAFLSWDHWYPDQHREYGIDMVDISDPAHPISRGTHSSVVIYDFCENNGYIYACDHEGIKILQPSSYELVQIGMFGAITYYIAGNGDHIFIGKSSLGDLTVLDATDPDSLIADDTYSGQGAVRDVAINGNYAYVASYSTGLSYLFGMNVVDISNPASPNVVGNIPIRANPFLTVSVSFPYAYYCWTGGGEIIDISDPADPIIVADTTLLAGTECAVIGNNDYIACGSSFKIVDVSDHSNPRLIGGYSNLGGSNHIFVAGQYAYINGGVNPESGVRIFNINDPANPTLVATVDTTAGDIFVSGDYLYFTSYNPALFIFNISNPADPQLVSSYSSGRANLVTVDGDYAFLATGSGIDAVNISDRQNPRSAANYNLTDIQNISVSGDLIYVAALYSLEILRFSPTGIEAIGRVPLEYSLSQNYPNPFNTSTEIAFELALPRHVKLSIFDILGRKIITLADENLRAGCQSRIWNGTDQAGREVSSGIYFYRLETGEQAAIKKN